MRARNCFTNHPGPTVLDRATRGSVVPCGCSQLTFFETHGWPTLVEQSLWNNQRPEQSKTGTTKDWNNLKTGTIKACPTKANPFTKRSMGHDTSACIMENG